MEYYALTDIGKIREKNQDQAATAINLKDQILGVVCDGMGGLKGGEIASQQAVCMFVEDFEQVRKTENNFYHFFCNEMIEIDDMVAGLTDERANFFLPEQP